MKILSRIGKILENGQFILSDELKRFEERFAQLCGTRYKLGVATGTDALFLTMRALNIGLGDEVITAPNSYLASASSITHVGAIPVFADVREDFNIDPEMIKQVVTPRIKAVIPVHLTGSQILQPDFWLPVIMIP